MGEELRKLWTTEDYWAVWLGLGIVLMALAVFLSGGTIKGWAFTIGVAVNVPLGYFLSSVVFSRYWSKISEMM